MSSPIKIFICYKKLLSPEKDGKIVQQKNTEAHYLNFILSQDEKKRYEPWIDDEELTAGMKWETEIYRRILESDVLLILIGPGTSTSEWVRREIAFANAFGISIVPLGFDLNWTEMEKEMKSLGIDNLQGKISLNIKLQSKDKHPSDHPLLSELSFDLQMASHRTKQEWEKTMRPIFDRRNLPTPKAPDNQSAAKFSIKLGDQLMNLHIATGNMFKARGIDVWVSSENNYMQMARIFESKTVSSMIRRLGARIRQDGRYEDTIQDELNFQLRDRGRPVQAAEVFVTSAGGPNSELARFNKARFIFHVAAVEVIDSELLLNPYRDPYHLEACVRNCLLKLDEINRQHGIISPPESDQRKDQENYAASGRGIARSIIFPLFGTGQAGASAGEVAGSMLSGIIVFLDDPENSELSKILNDIYISVFTEIDYNEVIRVLNEKLG